MDTEDEEDDDNNLLISCPKKKRNKYSYAKKKLVADQSIYLKHKSKDEWLTKYHGADVNLVGTITQCPNKKNDDHYSISWELV